MSIFPTTKIDNRHLSSIDGFWHIISHVRVIQIYVRPLTCMVFLFCLCPLKSSAKHTSLRFLCFILCAPIQAMFGCCSGAAFCQPILVTRFLLPSFWPHNMPMMYNIHLHFVALARFQDRGVCQLIFFERRIIRSHPYARKIAITILNAGYEQTPLSLLYKLIHLGQSLCINLWSPLHTLLTKGHLLSW